MLIVLKEHSQPRWFDRIAEYADAFNETSLPVEPFVYTREELQRIHAQSSSFLRAILRKLFPLSGNEQVWQVLKRNESQIR